MTKTPGYNIRLTIKLFTAKNGQQHATYWSRAAMRNLPLRRADAELFLATNQADAYAPFLAVAE